MQRKSDKECDDGDCLNVHASEAIQEYTLFNL
jgi:hypothetical protein